jgi:hypothetical protein
VTRWCNIYGWENPGGPRPAGGLVDNPVDERQGQWRCGRPADHRFRAVCAHGHEQGVDVWLCELCWRRLHGLVPGWTGATPYKTGFLAVCPRCQVTDPRTYPVPEYKLGADHRCQLRLEAVS